MWCTDICADKTPMLIKINEEIKGLFPWTRWCPLVISVLSRRTQEDCKFKDGLGYLARLGLSKEKRTGVGCVQDEGCDEHPGTMWSSSP